MSTRKYANAKRHTFWTLQHFMSTSSLALNVLALCLRENTPIDIHFGLCHTSCLRVSWRCMCWRCVYEKIRQATYILDFATLHVYDIVGVLELSSNISVLYVLALYLPIIRKHPPLSRRPLFLLFYFQVRKRPKIPSFACHVANYNNASCN